MNDFLKVTGHNGLVRNVSSNAIINIDETEYNSYVQRKLEQEQRNSISQQKEIEFDNLKNEVSEIKQTMLLILQALDK